MSPAESRPIVVEPRPMPPTRKIPGTPIPVELPEQIEAKSCLGYLADETLADLQAASRLVGGLWGVGLDDLLMAALHCVSGADIGRLWLAVLDRISPEALGTTKSGLDRRGPQSTAAAALASAMPPHLAGVLAVEAALGWADLSAHLRHYGAAAPREPDAHALLRHREDALAWLCSRIAAARRVASNGKEI